MPQIAQQDYIVIKPREGRAAQNDAECLRRLKQACENGTIFDCLLENPMTGEGFQSRIIAAASASIDFYDYENGELAEISLPYTVEQYSGLAAVQNAIDEKEGFVSSDLPTFEEVDANRITIYGGSENYYGCVNDHYLIPKIDDNDFLEGFEISDQKPAEGVSFVNITWEDAQKLIGLPLV